VGWETLRRVDEDMAHGGKLRGAGYTPWQRAVCGTRSRCRGGRRRGSEVRVRGDDPVDHARVTAGLAAMKSGSMAIPGRWRGLPVGRTHKAGAVRSASRLTREADSVWGGGAVVG
jgi:hypothetical protein